MVRVRQGRAIRVRLGLGYGLKLGLYMYNMVRVNNLTLPKTSTMAFDSKPQNLILENRSLGNSFLAP